MAAPAPVPAASQSNKRSPSDFLKQVVGRPVIVKLNSGVTYHGILACLDGYMNIAMEQTEEYVNGQLNEKYGDAFIRGNNGTDPPVSFSFLAPNSSIAVLYISTQKKREAKPQA